MASIGRGFDAWRDFFLPLSGNRPAFPPESDAQLERRNIQYKPRSFRISLHEGANARPLRDSEWWIVTRARVTRGIVGEYSHKVIPNYVSRGDLHGKNDFAEISKNSATDLKIILFDHESNYVERSKVRLLEC